MPEICGFNLFTTPPTGLLHLDAPSGCYIFNPPMDKVLSRIYEVFSDSVVRLDFCLFMTLTCSEENAALTYRLTSSSSKVFSSLTNQSLARLIDYLKLLIFGH